MAYIEFDRVVKEYPSGRTTIRALDEASFTADRGELTVILGQSGAGKTTALNILGGMDTATSGRVVVGGRDITVDTIRQCFSLTRAAARPFIESVWLGVKEELLK